MNEIDFGRLKKLLIATTAYYGIEINNDVLRMYAEDLSDFDLNSVATALVEIRNSTNIHRGNLLPIPPKVKEKILGNVSEIDDARDLAARIISAIQRVSYTEPERAREFVGEMGWEVIRLMGGWSRLCESEKSDNHILYAQIRDLAVSYGHRYQAGVSNTPPELPPSPKGKFDLNKQIGWKG